MTNEVKKDFRQELTDKFVAALTEGRIPWQRPWHESATPLSGPVNAISEKPYQGGNKLILTLTQIDKSYTDPRWVTYNQAQTLGGSVSKGEKGTQIEFWREKPFYQRRDVDVKLGGSTVKVMDEKDGVVTLAGGRTAPVLAFVVHNDGKEYSWKQAEKKLNTLVGQTHTIFNVGQCQDLKIEPLAPKPISVMPMHERGELFLEGMKKDGVRFVEAPNRAFYRPASDTISLPPRDDFKSEALFYGTALHESAHATSNEKRLNREVGKDGFGSESYAKEELVAEMTSAFLSAETGIPHDMDEHKAYIQSWAAALKNDKNEIFRAAKMADQAANYMHDRANEVLLEQNQSQKQEVSVAQSPETELREIWTEKGIPVERQDELIKDIADKAKPGANVGPFKIGDLPGNRVDLSHIMSALPGIDKQMIDDRAKFDLGTRNRIAESIMNKADKELASGKMEQANYDRIADKYAKPDMSGMDKLTDDEIVIGNYKPSPDSSIYVEKGFLTIDHEDSKISFGSSTAMQEAAEHYNLTNRDLMTADLVQMKQNEIHDQELESKVELTR